MPGEVATSAVSAFYNDARIFLTGGTGFLGKVLMEKLLRVCPDINHIYILIRVKKGKDPEARLKELFDSPLFKKLKVEHPDFMKKITCISGDVSGLRLNMSDSDYDFLTKEVTHVIHSAATVRFNETLKTAAHINVRGTREIVEFCKKCIRLKVFVHVSTAFSNCVRREVDEVFYEPPLTSENILNLVDSIPEDKLVAITPELIKPWPNTYCYTKAIAESVVRENARTIPALVFRPSIVIGSMSEPISGWIDNIYGPIGVVVGVGLGVLRVLHADNSSKANIVPVDLVINALLSSSWEIGSSRNNLTEDSSLGKDSEKVTEVEPKVFNYGTDNSNSLSWNDFLEKSLQTGRKYPSNKAIWYYTVTLTNVKIWYLFLILFLHFIPGALIDGTLVLLGKKPQMIKTYQKIYTFTDLLHYFASQSWNFHDYNRRKLWSRLNEKDKEIYNFDMWNINWDSYLNDIILGIRSHLLKEKDDELMAARRKHTMLWLAHRLLQVLFTVTCLWILSKFLFTYDSFKSHFKDIIIPAGTFRNST